jgi:hypothetical protein
MEEKINKAIEVAKARLLALTVQIDMQQAAQAVLNLKRAAAEYKSLVNPTEELDKEIAFVLGRVRSNLGAIEMQQVTQAVLHLVSAKAQGRESGQPAKRGPGRPKKDKSEVKPDEQNNDT